jgi:hypothetical protein
MVSAQPELATTINSTSCVPDVEYKTVLFGLVDVIPKPKSHSQVVSCPLPGNEKSVKDVESPIQTFVLLKLANGTETKITLGNFYTDNTTSAVLTNFFNIYDNGVYNIDDISLIPIDIKAFAGNDITICIGDSIELGRPQEVGLDCMWYNLGNTTSFSNTSNFTFKATQTGVFSFVQKNYELSY